MSLLIISKWELKRTKSIFSRNTLVLSASLLILIGLVSFYMFQSGFQTNGNIYTVISTDPVIFQVLKTDPKFDVSIAQEQEARAMFGQGGFDILITGNSVSHKNSEKSISALDALDKAISRYDEARLLSYNDLNNTFPVWITIKNIPREQSLYIQGLQRLPELETERTEKTPPVPETPIKETQPVKPIQIISVKEVTETRSFLAIKEQNLATPSHFNPPIPFKAVVLTFLFIFPMYFIAQFFSSSIMEERVNRRGELLLVSPASPYEIVMGKLLPYLLVTLALMAGIVVYIGGNALILVILLPVALMFLSTAFLGAIIARSFKEFTYILVFLSVILSGFFIFPAMFANIHDISIISPMTLVVRLLEGEGVSINDYIFSTLPFYLVSILIFTFGIFIYREEDLFTQKPVRSKFLDSIQVFMERVPAPLFFLSIVLLPVVFSVQLMLVVLLFNIPIRIGIMLFIFLAALIEEAVKSAGIYTVFSRKIAEATTGNALRFGILSGTGFFVGEKVLLLPVIAGIAGSPFGSVMGIGLLLFPLILHVTAATTASLGIRFGMKYPVSVFIASLIHTAYNLYLVRGVLFA